MNKVGYKNDWLGHSRGTVRAGLEMKYHLSDCQSIAQVAGSLEVYTGYILGISTG